MAKVNKRLQELAMQHAADFHSLTQECKRAEIQDKETYERAWQEYASQPHIETLLRYVGKLVRGQPQNQVIKQPLGANKNSLEGLQELASAQVCTGLHRRLKGLVEGHGGVYTSGSRKRLDRCVQKVEADYGGDYARLLDLERGMGLFERTEDMLRCLRSLVESSSSGSSSVTLLRCKDRLNHPQTGG